MIAELILRCRCGRELRIVKLLPGHDPILAHATNPGPAHHYPRPASRSDHDALGERRGPSGVSATRREDAPNADPSYPLTTSGTRAKSKGSAGSRDNPSRTSTPSRPPLGGAPALPLVRLGTRTRRPSQPSAERRS